ncbi:MAG: hypothetical protein KKI08_19340, partial [Armatimonadetes bacterium]|nr:hypothetical protein [Armatimonadota bacterium]
MLPAIRQRAPACAFLSAVLLVGLWIAPHGVAQCESCGTSPEESVFDVWQSGLNPYTLGLPVGARAPEISGFGVPGELTLLVAINSTCNPEYLGLIELWGRELPELRIVALLTGLNRGLKASFIA